MGQEIKKKTNQRSNQSFKNKKVLLDVPILSFSLIKLMYASNCFQENSIPTITKMTETKKTLYSHKQQGKGWCKKQRQAGPTEAKLPNRTFTGPTKVKRGGKRGGR